MSSVLFFVSAGRQVWCGDRCGNPPKALWSKSTASACGSRRTRANDVVRAFGSVTCSDERLGAATAGNRRADNSPIPIFTSDDACRLPPFAESRAFFDGNEELGRL